MLESLCRRPSLALSDIFERVPFEYRTKFVTLACNASAYCCFSTAMKHSLLLLFLIPLWWTFFFNNSALLCLLSAYIVRTHLMCSFVFLQLQEWLSRLRSARSAQKIPLADSGPHHRRSRPANRLLQPRFSLRNPVIQSKEVTSEESRRGEVEVNNKP